MYKPLLGLMIVAPVYCAFADSSGQEAVGVCIGKAIGDACEMYGLSGSCLESYRRTVTLADGWVPEPRDNTVDEFEKFARREVICSSGLITVREHWYYWLAGVLLSSFGAIWKARKSRG